MEEVQIAICGSGIAGLCIAYGLLQRRPQWRVRIFEASPEARDESVAMGLGNNAQDALSLISPETRQALDEAGAVCMEPTLRLKVGTGEHAGRHIGDFAPAVSQRVVHRGRFWRALRKLLPSDIIETGKKLVEARPSSKNGRVELLFEDGSSFETNALLGCDGINSITRQAVLGADHPSLAPQYSNAYGHVTLVPIERARRVFGQEYCSHQTQHAWIGDGGMLLTDIADEGESMQFIASWVNRENWTHAQPFVEWPKQDLEHKLSEWGEFGQSMKQIFFGEPTLYAVGLREHPDTPTYCKGAICLVGDAAQSFLPFQGAGAGQAIEDALMLSTVLGACSSADSIPKAFRVYDALRRPRRAQVARSSRWASLYLTGQAPGIGLDLDRLATEVPKWNSHIYDYDLSAAQTEALQQMKQDGC